MNRARLLPAATLERMGLRFEVEKADERRILALRVRRVEDAVEHRHG